MTFTRQPSHQRLVFLSTSRREGSHTLRMEFDEMPARVTFKEDSKTSIEYTAAGTNTASAIAQDLDDRKAGPACIQSWYRQPSGQRDID